MRLVYDSDVAADIPAAASMVAGYVDGVNPWSAADWARFPNAVHVRIARNSLTNDGHVADIEGGAMPLPYFLNWARLRLRSGLVAVTAYVNRSNGKAVEDICLNAGFLPRDGRILLWVSTLDGTTTVTHWSDGSPVVFPVVAVQFAGEGLSGGHYDLSDAADFWPGVDMLTQADIDAIVTAIVNRAEFQDLFWRERTAIRNDATVPQSAGSADAKGEINGVAAELAAIHAAVAKITPGVIPPGTTFTATTK